MGLMTKTRAALAGMTAAAAAVGLAELVAVLTGPRSAPIIAVGGWIVDNVPEGGKQLAIRLFGVHDKTALLIGTGVLLLAFAALIGLAARRRLLWGDLGIGLFALIGIGASVTRHNATALWALPTLIGSAAAVVILHLLVRQQQQAIADGVPDSDARRQFLKIAGITVGGSIVGGVVGRALASRRSVAEARSAVRLPPAESPAPSDVVTGYETPNKSFYRIDTALVVPQVDPAAWKLRIHGRVDREVTVTYSELLAMPMVERYMTLACVSNDVGGNLIGNARWLGVPVKGLLERAGIKSGADQVVQRSVDGWTCGTPTSVLVDGRDALLAVGMNGVPLPIEHGFPVRMVVPGLYGYVSACKWITELELSTFADFDAYWVRRGWAAQAVIKTESRIDTPGDGSTKPAGQVTIAGVAWAQHRGITKVEVRVAPDGGSGTWREAELLPTVSPDTWRQWRLTWDATPGDYAITVRATDATGATQTEEQAPPEPDGATGWHTTFVTIK
jgi:DMSO/TMAO reductase YedYZ molybdopterin-dependent catalytic subunit